MLKTIIIGAGGHATVVIDVLRNVGDFEIVGCLADDKYVADPAKGVSVLGSVSELPKIAREFPTVYGLVAIGSNYVRSCVVEQIEKEYPALNWATAIHNSAVIGASAEVQPGSVVAAGCVIGTKSRIGRHVIVNTASSLDHHNILADFSSVGPGVIAGGNVKLGRMSYVGLGSSVIHGVEIGAHCVIGAASLVLKSCDNNGVFYGIPTERIRDRNPHDSYL